MITEILELLDKTKTIFVNKRGGITKASRVEAIYNTYITVQREGINTNLKKLSRLYEFINKNRQYLPNDKEG